MGSDFLVAHLWTHRAIDGLEWDRGYAAIETMDLKEVDADNVIDTSDAELDGLEGDALDAAVNHAVRQQLAKDLTYLLDQVKTGGDREVEICRMGLINVVMTGGMSYGDGPTEAFDVFTRIPEYVLEEVGFFDEHVCEPAA